MNTFERVTSADDVFNVTAAGLRYSVLYMWKMTKQYDSFITDVCALEQEAENET